MCLKRAAESDIAGFYKTRLRVTPLGALVAIVGGGGAALIIQYFNLGALLHMKWLGLAGLLISAILLFVVSFIDNNMKSVRNIVMLCSTEHL